MRYLSTLDKKFIKNLLNGKEDPVVVEVGSHYGEDTREFLDEFEQIKIFCFEPDPRNIQIIKKYLDTTRINFYECAVSDQDKEGVDFYMATKAPPKDVPKKYQWISREDYHNLNLNRSGASSLKSGHQALDEGLKTKVRTIKLDTWASDNDIDFVDFIWIDVQGAEKEVLKGATEVLKNTKYLYMEYGEMGYNDSMSLEQTIELLKSNGFDIQKVFRQGDKGDILAVNSKLIGEGDLQ